MTRRHRNTEPVSVQEDRPIVKEAPVIPEPPKQVVTDGKEQQSTPSVKKKRVRHRQTVKLHNKKLSVAVICANPYLRQFL
jgi:hypothetical protein